MGNQHEIRQVEPRRGLGVVIPVRPEHGEAVSRLIEAARQEGSFYSVFCPAGVEINVANLDGPWIELPPQSCDRVIIQSGGKMWSGYDVFSNHLMSLETHLEDALFYIGDEQDFIDEFRLTDGHLHYRRVHEGCWRPVKGFLQKQGLWPADDPD